MTTQTKEYQAQTQKWMFLIDQSIKELRDLIKEDVKQTVNETLLSSPAFNSAAKDPLANETVGTDYLTVDQAIALLHVSKPTLHRYRKENAVSVSRVGRRVLFKRSDLVEAIKVKPKNKGGKQLVN